MVVKQCQRCYSENRRATKPIQVSTIKLCIVQCPYVCVCVSVVILDQCQWEMQRKV